MTSPTRATGPLARAYADEHRNRFGRPSFVIEVSLTCHRRHIWGSVRCSDAHSGMLKVRLSIKLLYSGV